MNSARRSDEAVRGPGRRHHECCPDLRSFQLQDRLGYGGAASQHGQAVGQHWHARGRSDRMMNSYSNMLEQSLSQAELRARKVTELAAAEKFRGKEPGCNPGNRAAETGRANPYCEGRLRTTGEFLLLSDQVSNQLTTLSTKFSDTTPARERHDTACSGRPRIRADRTSASHAKVLPETAKQSASAMRRALQDQLSALDALSELSNRHAYTSAISTPDSLVPRRPPRS